MLCYVFYPARSGCFAVNLTTFEPTVNYTIGTYINATAFTLESCLSNCSSMGYYFAAPFVPSTGNQLMCGCLHNYQHLDLQMDLRCNETCGASMCGGIESAGVYSPLGKKQDQEDVALCFAISAFKLCCYCKGMTKLPALDLVSTSLISCFKEKEGGVFELSYFTCIHVSNAHCFDVAFVLLVV